MKLLSASLQISCFVLQISDPLSLPFLRSETVISVSLLFCSLSLSLFVDCGWSLSESESHLFIILFWYFSDYFGFMGK